MSRKEFKVSAELPGLDENDIEVTLANDMTITIPKTAEVQKQIKRIPIKTR